MNRHQFLRTMAAAAFSLAATRASHNEQPAVPRTYIYKTAGGCEIKADVYNASKTVRKPVIVWIHGGALINGAREAPPHWLDPEGRYVIVSIDYRLAPETKLPAIMRDIQDAFRWISQRGPELFRIDSQNVSVAGASAGGYLTLMTGFCVSPRPRALLSLSGYGDITAAWYSRPSSFYLRQPRVSREEAYRSVGNTCISSAPGKNPRSKFYLYCRQHGIWPQEVTGHNPKLEPHWFDQYCPVRNVSMKYPPTVLIHAADDTDVPFEESVNMDKELSRLKLQHRFLRVRKGGHCLGEAPPALQARVFGEAVGFFQSYMA